MKVQLVKKLQNYEKDGVVNQTHALYVVLPNGWKIRVKPCFKGRDFYDLLAIADDLDEKADK